MPFDCEGPLAMTPVRVLIADDHEVVAAALCALLAEQPDIHVLGVATDGVSALQMTRDLQPDLVLMDILMPGLNGIELTARIREVDRQCRILILSMLDDVEHVHRAFRAGAGGYVHKSCAARDTLSAIRTVARGGRFLAPTLAAELARRLAEGHPENPLETLSPREIEVLRMLASSLTSNDIASQLGLSIKTIETYRSRLMEKLDIHDLAGLVRFAVRHNLIGD